LVAESLYDRAYTARLENGLRIFVEEDPRSRSVSVGTWIKVGGRDDPAEFPGLSHFIEHLAFKGSKTRDAAQISREIDSVGGNLNAATGRESTVFYADAPAEGLGTAIDLLSDLVQSPAFDPEKIELERTVVLDEIRGHEDDPESSAFDLFIDGVWAGTHPLSRSVLGAAEAVGTAPETEIVAHYQRNYRPEGMVVAACGAIDVGAFVDGVAALYEASVGPSSDCESRSAPTFSIGRTHHNRKTGQTHIYFALPGSTATDPDRYPLEVLNVLLGDGTSSRLFRAIREDRGLAYSVGSTVLRYSDAGLWMIYAGTAPKHAAEVREEIERELERLREAGIDEVELSLAKARLRGLFILGMESNANRAMRLGTAAISGREILSPDEVLSDLDAVGLSDIDRVLNRFLVMEKLHLTTVGPSS